MSDQNSSWSDISQHCSDINMFGNLMSTSECAWNNMYNYTVYTLYRLTAHKNMTLILKVPIPPSHQVLLVSLSLCHCFQPPGQHAASFLVVLDHRQHSSASCRSTICTPSTRAGIGRINGYIQARAMTELVSCG